LFLSELRQISTKFDNFWHTACTRQTDGQTGKICNAVNLFYSIKINQKVKIRAT